MRRITLIYVVIGILATAGVAFVLNSIMQNKSQAQQNQGVGSRMTGTSSLLPENKSKPPKAASQQNNSADPAPRAADGREQISSASDSAGLISPERETDLSAEEAEVGVLDGLVAAESYKEAIKLARKLMRSTSPQIRQGVVDNLGWIGIEAIAELSMMLRDPDAEVAESAFTHWAQAVDSLESDQLKAQILVAGMTVVNDESSLQSGIMMFDSMEDAVSIPALVEIIESGNPTASEVAREHYEFSTGEEYTSRTAANAWLKAK
ncbi:MAG: HEAT repeat domain-containing protein [Kiritimatiellae bacterium]|nr:HEAT repeat domain-containing protein [Kiritimatiellia bacterium]